MVYGFIKQSGGHIKIDSEEGRGTTVSLYLPRRHPGAAPPSAVATRQLQRGSETVLVVEDDALVRGYVVAQLKSLGYQHDYRRQWSRCAGFAEPRSVAFDVLLH